MNTKRYIHTRKQARSNKVQSKIAIVGQYTAVLTFLIAIGIIIYNTAI